MHKSVSVVLALLVLVGCQPKTEPEPAAPVEIVTAPDYSVLSTVLAGNWRTDKSKARDIYRHPAQTLDFCEIDPAGQVAEIWPGAGWYSQILLPWIHANGGHFTAVAVDPTRSQPAADLLLRYLEQYADRELYGEFSHSILSATSGPIAPADSQDAILTFRNIHSWMGRGMSEKAFADFYAALKPGGVLCVVEHRLPSAAVQDSKAPTGYVQEAMAKALASEAGFLFEASAEINANPDDEADHPFGVWTLPPVQRSPRDDEERAANPDFDRAIYDTIGESDRMTLRFRKPAAAPTTEESQP
ncbi:MAG: methyltransferase [Robiginitomaculum sp.]|nr:MAG: methyltransferase [Robiginitomaculum sp.]